SSLLMLAAAAFRTEAPAQSPAPTNWDSEISVLRERAATFWAARVAGDAETQWQLLEPRGKGLLTPQQYGEVPTGGKVLAYQVLDATTNGYFATVKVKLLVQQMLSSPGQVRTLAAQTTIVEDGWIRIGGVWYRRMPDGRNPG